MGLDQTPTPPLPSRRGATVYRPLQAAGVAAGSGQCGRGRPSGRGGHCGRAGGRAAAAGHSVPQRRVCGGHRCGGGAG